MQCKLEGKGIIFSPDLIDIERAFEIINDCRDYFSALKIGNITMLKYGIGILYWHLVCLPTFNYK